MDDDGDSSGVQCRAFDSDYDKRGKSKRQEKRIAKHVSGRVQPASGAIVGLKGDVKSDDFLIEAKRTDGKSISIQGEWLTKIDAEATLANKLPAVSIEIGGLSRLTEKDWVMVPMSVFKKFTTRINE